MNWAAQPSDLCTQIGNVIVRSRGRARSRGHSPYENVFELDSTRSQLGAVVTDGVVGAVLPERLVVGAVGAHVAPAATIGVNVIVRILLRAP